jgi:hypothetical protein
MNEASGDQTVVGRQKPVSREKTSYTRTLAATESRNVHSGGLIAMPLFPLGISRRRDALHEVEQIAAEFGKISWHYTGELACAIVEAPQDAFRPMQHAAALELIHRRMCVLPLRSGTAMSDKVEIHNLLQSHSQELLKHLDRLDDASEMALRITLRQLRRRFVDLPFANPLPSAYLQQRRMHYQRTDAAEELSQRIVMRFVDQLQGTYRDWRRLQPAPLHVVRLAFLVGRNCIDAFRCRLEGISDTRGKMQVTALGPWPPYSFV